MRLLRNIRIMNGPSRFYRTLKKHREIIESMELELKKPTIDRMPFWKIKKIAEDELYRLSELTLEYPNMSHKSLDEYKERLWIIMGIK